MSARALFLALVAIPFVFTASAHAAERYDSASPLIILAQAACPEGTQCPNIGAGESGENKGDRKRRRRQRNAEEDDSGSEGNAEDQAERKERKKERKAKKQERKQRRRESEQQQQADEQGETGEQPDAQSADEGTSANDDEARRARRERRQRRQRRNVEQQQPPVIQDPAREQGQSQEADNRETAGDDDDSDAVKRARRRQRELRNRRRANQEQSGQRQRRRDEARQQRRQQRQQREDDAVVEQQLEAQGDEEEARNVRELRDQILEELGTALGAPPAATVNRNRNQGRREARRARRLYEHDARRGRVVEERAGRRVIDLGNGLARVEPVVPDEGGRLLFGAEHVQVENLRGGRTRTTIYRRNGSRIVTVRNRFGDILRRIKVTPRGREIVLFENRPDDRRRPPAGTQRYVPPPRINIPYNQYVVDLGRASRRDLKQALLAPPVAPLPQPYALEEVLSSEPIRAYAPRIDLDTITFDFGRATIGYDQMDALFELGEVMEQVIAENPDEVYLIEGHTDAVGSDYDNLILSDRRAEAVAVALSQNFYIPPENLVTEGYGEQYLKVPVPYAERRNRRATVRRLTGILQTQY